MSKNIDPENIRKTGIIISLSREIESEMTKMGADGAGLHDKTDFLQDKLSKECIKLLHFIASVRNQNAHEAVVVSDEDMELFVQSCESVMQELKSLQAADEKNQSGNTADGTLNISGGEKESFDDTFLRQLNLTWRIIAWIPFLHVIYALGGMLKELKSSAIYILLILFYFSGIIMFGTGISDGSSFFIWSGILMFLLVYVYAVVLRLRDKEEKLHRNFCLIIGLHIVYLCYMTWRKTKVLHFSLYIGLIILYAAGAIMLYKENSGVFGLILLGISYVGGAVDSLFAKIKKTDTIKE